MYACVVYLVAAYMLDIFIGPVTQYALCIHSGSTHSVAFCLPPFQLQMLTEFPLKSNRPKQILLVLRHGKSTIVQNACVHMLFRLIFFQLKMRTAHDVYDSVVDHENCVLDLD